MNYLRPPFTYTYFYSCLVPMTIMLLGLVLVLSCQSDIDNGLQQEKVSLKPIKMAGFEIVPSSQTHVAFENTLHFDALKSIVYYINVYNGGGVALGDINNDDLIDIYLTGNLVENKLYLNKGNLQFEDISDKAGVSCKDRWSTGASFADVNNDGLLDLYVCHSYDDENPHKRANSLFINQGDNSFKEQAKQYGVADIGYSIQASFLDYNKDGYADLFLGNTPRHETGDFFFIDPNVHYNHFVNPRNPMWSDKLFQNNGNGTFTDVTLKAGLFNYGYMLGVSVADFNGDNWPDIYVAVDHGNPDYLYMNNRDGTFTNTIHESFKHISLSSMGTDASDLNNDGKIDLVSLDMLSQDNFSEKTQMGAMDPKNFHKGVEAGMHYQYMRNMLQLNQGNGKFTEIGQMAGIHKSDWSWSVLAADFSNDGWKDLFITNGFYKSVMDKDIRKKFEKIIAVSDPKKHKTFAKVFDSKLNPQRNKNLLFQNNGDYTFKNVSAETGSDENGFSSGAAYADLDNDGDLDLVINNIDKKASILKNTQRENKKGSYIKIKLINKNGSSDLGSKVEIKTCDQNQFYESTYSRGYQSSVVGPIHFGLGNCKNVSFIRVTWPDGKTQVLNDLKPNKLVEIKYNPDNNNSPVQLTNRFMEESNAAEISPLFKHMENKFDDYEKQVLLPHKMSQFGPIISKADVNNDGFEDFFIGGAKDQSASIYIYNPTLKKFQSNSSYFENQKTCEDLGSIFFDLDKDGDLDLYVVSGGNEFEKDSPYYQDRIYINNGTGAFQYSKDLSPKIFQSGSSVQSSDFDNDGDLDIFVGTRLLPHEYPFSAPSYLLKNNAGTLEIAQEIFSIDQKNMAMVTDACFVDLNGDNLEDLIVVGEWMPINIFINNEGTFENKTEAYNLSESQGWWNCIEKADLDNDGDQDFVLGNLGLNYKYKASLEKPFHIYAGDFDKNGKSDIVLGQYYLNELCPVRGRQCSSEQMPQLAEKFPTYNEFGKANLSAVYGEYLEEAYHLQVNTFASSFLYNEDGKLKLVKMPNEAQFSPINDVLLKDLDNDQHLDIIAGGNLFVSEVETGRADGGVGVTLLNKGAGRFKSISSEESGLYIDRDVKSLTLLDNKYLLVGNNNEAMQVYKFK